MDGSRLAPILLSVSGISIGQVMLKLAALDSKSSSSHSHPAFALLLNTHFIGGVALLGCSTVLWTWVLRTVPLNATYPFTALAFVLVPSISFVLLGEPFTLRQAAGTALIIAGVLVAST
jgi:undecaprenyl phosphate-alpha-L-ara4N flippase subunit ArnE